MHVSKVWRWSLKNGLLLILLVLPTVIGIPLYLLLVKKRKWGLVNRIVLMTSRYRGVARYVIAQSKHESNNLRSHVYEVDNNMFGMKMPSHRSYLGTQGLKAPDGGYYQHYKTDTQSLRDLFLYFDYVNFPKEVSNSDQYAYELFKRSYFGTGKDVELQAYEAGLNAYLS